MRSSLRRFAIGSEGSEAIWDDAISEQKRYNQWLNQLANDQPDLGAIETEAPTIKYYWKAIADIKAVSPKTKTALYGDHVTAFLLRNLS